MNPEGTHYLVDLWGVSPTVLDNPVWLAQLMTHAVKRGQLTELDRMTHWFDPQGITMIGLLAESHISFHTYPEHRYMAIDLYTCGSLARPDAALDLLMEELAPESFHIQHLTRGQREASHESVSG